MHESGLNALEPGVVRGLRGRGDAVVQDVMFVKDQRFAISFYFLYISYLLSTGGNSRPGRNFLFRLMRHTRRARGAHKMVGN